MDPRIKLAFRIVKLETDKRYTVRQMAERLGLSESRFEHLFQEEVGIPFKVYEHELRLHGAKKMLRDCTLRVEEVAHANGWEHAHDFTRDFTKRYGKPPSQYRISPTIRPR